MKNLIKQILREEIDDLGWIKSSLSNNWEPFEAAKFLNISANSKYRRVIDRYLERIYRDLGQWENNAVYVDGKRSILNYANTNHKLAAFLLNTLYVDHYDEPDSFYKKLYKYYIEFFHPNGKYYSKVMNILEGTSKYGDKRETIAVRILKNRMKIPSTFEVGGLGNVTDMKTGVDIRMKTDDGREFTFQVKPYTNTIENNEGDIIINDVNGASLYDNRVNFMFFVKDLNNYLIFYNRDFELVDRKTMKTKKDNLYARS